MKTSLWKSTGLVAVLTLGVWASTPRASGQTPAGLTIQTYAGLAITGAVRTVYSIDYVTDLAQTNTPSAWRCLEFLQLPASPYLWADKSAPATGRRFYRAVQTGAPTNMVFIPPGTFRMGSPTNETDRLEFEGPQTDVIISRGFWMGKYEVTQREYHNVMATNPSSFGGDLSRPVERVTWHDATNYCAQLTHQERAASRVPTNCGFRLPTEAEWEYACRAWTSTRFSYGDDPDYTSLASYGWYSANSGHTTQPVGQKLPNSWGLHDMHGNVWEWCLDWWDYYPGGIAVDPQGPTSGWSRTARGGDFADTSYCRSACRLFGSDPDNGSDNVGFRVVLAPSQP
jgi:formylglycine-generating enzyme required for sulfatase activity